MKRIFSLILCVLMLVPSMASLAFAEELDTEYKNFALEDNMGSYASSIWNADSDPKYINNDVLEDSYRFWRPQGVDRNPALDDKVQYCGLRSSSKYYEVQEVVIYHGIYSADNNIKYTIKALVLGEWVEIGSAYDLETTPMPGSEEGVGILKIDVTDVVTREIRLECSEWGRWATSNSHLPKDPMYDDLTTPDVDESKTPTSWHDWWKVPLIHELQTWGVEAPAPAWDVPFGAVLTTNACLGGMAEATSTNTLLGIYSGLAIDDNKRPTPIVPRPYWQASTKGGGEAIWCEFDRAYDIVNVSANFGGSVDGVELVFDVQILVNGNWVTVASDKKATSTIEGQDDIVFELDGKKNASGVKFIFTSAKGGVKAADKDKAIITEMGALIDSEYKIWDEARQEMVDANKCVFLRDYMTNNRKQSTGAGNLAIYGTAYASSVFSYASISSIEYINDGGISRSEDKAWFANTFAKGTYCGVILKDEFNVDKVVLYFNDPVSDSYVNDNENAGGGCIMEVEVQAKVNGEFKTVKTGITSYDKGTNDYIVSVQFDAPVKTNDVRIVYTSNGMVFPYIKELEVYSSQEMYMSFYGYQIGNQRKLGGKDATLAENFAARTLIPRSTYLDKISPIQYFEVTRNYDIKVLAWI